MNKKDVIEYFGSVRKTAEALGVSTQYVSQWPEKVPQVQAARCEKITDGGLQYKMDEYPADG